jgi:hypothetical protein
VDKVVGRWPFMEMHHKRLFLLQAAIGSHINNLASVETINLKKFGNLANVRNH